jgi:catechol 2,3-dioxygenase-like lactoylglutathione lyase family enzyme
MKREDIPVPREGVFVTHLLVVRDQDTSRQWYRDVLGAEVVNEHDPLMLKFHNSWLILTSVEDRLTTSPRSPSSRPVTHRARARSSTSGSLTSSRSMRSGAPVERNF